MSCEKIHKYLDEYACGEISFFVKAQVEEHIASCPKCREEVETLQKMYTTLHSMPRITVENSFKDGINEKLDAMPEEEQTAKKKTTKKYVFWRDWRTYSALAACVVLAVVLQSSIGDFYWKESGPERLENVASLDAQEVQYTTGAPDVPLASVNPIENTQKAAGNATFSAPEATPKKNDAAAQTAEPKARTAEPPAGEPTQAAPTAEVAEMQAETGVKSRIMESRVAEDSQNMAPTPQPEPTEDTKAVDSAMGGQEKQATGSTLWDWDADSGSDDEKINPAQVPAGGTVVVDSEDLSKAREIADKYGKEQDGTVEMTRSTLNNYLQTLEENDISYSQNIPGGDMVTVEIIAN